MIRVLTAYLVFASVAAADDNIHIFQVAQGHNVSLPCTAGSKPGVEYRACRWYKEGKEPRLTGLVSRTPPTGEMRWYVDADTRISLEVSSLNLLLPPVSCKDSGVYQCYMAAPVGQQNREGRVRLSVLDCPVEIEKTPVIPAVVVNQQALWILAAGLVVVVVLGVALTYLCLRRAQWSKAKSVDKLLYPDLSYPMEKQGLMLPNFMPSHSFKAFPSNFNNI